MMIGSQWPPSPRVEDEELALENEITQHPGLRTKTEAEEALCRGAVDQYPIILDSNHAPEPKYDYTSSTDNEGEGSKSHSSDDSYGPPTPPNSKASRKKIQLPSNSSNSASLPGKAMPSWNISKQPDQEVSGRGRPHMPRIKTDLGSDLQGMITGQRRAPSPYAYTKTEVPPKEDSYKRHSGHTFLPPDKIALGQVCSAADSNKRFSAQPPSKPRSSNYSDDSSDNEQRGHHHSGRRLTRDTFPKGYVPDHGPPYCAYRQSRNGEQIRTGVDTEASQRPDTNGCPKKLISNESPNTSSADESGSRGRSHFVSRSEARVSKETQYGSFTEEARSHRGEPVPSKASELPRLHHESAPRKERPRLDLSDHRYSYHGIPSEERQGSARHAKHGNPIIDRRSYLGPSSVRSPKAMEEYLEKAFKDNQVKTRRGSPNPSPSASPYGSPPRTPLRTPRVERGSKDSFSAGMSDSPPPSDTMRARAPAPSDGQYSQVKPLPGVMAAAVGSRMVPPMSGASNSSAEVYSSSNHYKPANPQRSRHSSPVAEQRAPPPRPGRDQEKVVPKIMRDEERFNSRPPLTSASTSYHHPPVPSSSERFDAKSATYAPLLAETSRSNQRAFSYSGADDSQHLRLPSSAKSSQARFAPSLTSNPAAGPASPRLPRSPSSSEKAGWIPQLSELPPCPRSRPVAGLYDWYTVVGMPQLDICPSCMTILGASRFRDMFVPNPTTIPGQQVLCDFSRPWIRRAWSQTIKQRRGSLEMLHQIVRNLETTKPCPGKGTDVRSWYRLPDPETGSNVPYFDACSECVRSIEILFPQLRGIFKRGGPLVQERTCDLSPQSRRFEKYLRLLESSALQYDVDRLREPNIQAFANYARKAARVRECTRDDMVMGQPWHFIPSLPEFTVCEECFDEVIWPVADQPVASSFNRTLQLVPNTQRTTGISCQLYSERMRKAFAEAVKYADFDFLKQVALRRYGVERLLQEKHKLLMNDMAMGKGRTAELQANVEEWRKWE